MEEQPTLSLGGKDYPIRVPRSFADREDILTAWRDSKTKPKTRRIFGATLALCVPELAALVPGTSSDDMDCDLFAYGKLVYDKLRGDGVSVDAISTAANAAFKAVVASLYPRSDAVRAKEVFSEGEATPT